MPEASFTIGQLATVTGCKVQTIRYYEEIGLMAAAERTMGNQRRYGQRQFKRLAFIRHSRELGFRLDAIRELLSLADDPDQSCKAVDQIVARQLRLVESRIDRLQALKSEFKRMLAQCRGRRIADCRIIEVLGDHSKCLAQRHA
jgi:DNA-binding transcriptional MerR regulator